VIAFQATIELNNINPYVLVSADRATELKAGWKKPLPVLVRVNGKPEEPWRINMMPIGDGSFYLYLSGVVRKASNTAVGDTVDIELEFDSDYRAGPTDPMPHQMQVALTKDPLAKERWEALTPSRQKEVLRYFASLKSAEAVERNIDKFMRTLTATQERFMARTWEHGK
jgi:hypothetical protein